MILVIFSTPICLLSLYLAYLCYRQARYQHALVLTLIAAFMLLTTLGLLAAGYFTGVAIQASPA